MFFPCLFQLLMVAGNPWGPLPCRFIFPISASVAIFPLCICVSPTCLFLGRPPAFRFRAQRGPVGPHLHLVTSPMILFPNKITFTEVKVGTSTYLFGGTQFNPQLRFTEYLLCLRDCFRYIAHRIILEVPTTFLHRS